MGHSPHSIIKLKIEGNLDLEPVCVVELVDMSLNKLWYNYRVEKVINKTRLEDHHQYDLDYWLSKTPEERIAAVEALRLEYIRRCRRCATLGYNSHQGDGTQEHHPDGSRSQHTRRYRCSASFQKIPAGREGSDGTIPGTCSLSQHLIGSSSHGYCSVGIQLTRLRRSLDPHAHFSSW